jgi:CheY-like chemotaxis protein
MTEPLTILSVDDDAVNQTVIEMLLEGSGYQVLQAMDGVEALEVLEKCETLPALALVDVMMPRMSGYELCRKIRELYPPHFPVIMISAKSSKEDIIQGLECMCNDYVTKPFDKEELLARIQTLIKLNRMRSEEERRDCHSSLRKPALPKLQPPATQPFKAVAVKIIPGKPGESMTAFFEILAKKFDIFSIPNRIGGVFTAVLINDDWEERFVGFMMAVNDYCDESRSATCFAAVGDCRTFPFSLDSEKDVVPSVVFQGPVIEELNALVVQWAENQSSEALLTVSNTFPHHISETLKQAVKIQVVVLQSKPSDSEIEELKSNRQALLDELGDTLQGWDDVEKLEATVLRLHDQVAVLESEYVEKCKAVNAKLNFTLQVESLNEMMFLEMKRREFEHSPYRC